MYRRDLQLGSVVGVGHVISTLGAGDKPAPLSHLDTIYTLLHHVFQESAYIF
jgi:hypothetical protein